MKHCAELLFSIMCHCFAILLLVAISTLSLEGTGAFVAIVFAFIMAVIGLVAGVHGFLSSRKS